jgi:hypothetical protein
MLGVGSTCLLTGSCCLPMAAAAPAAEPGGISVPSLDREEGHEGLGRPTGQDGRLIHLRGALSQEYDDHVDNDNPRDQRGDFITLQSLSLTALPHLRGATRGR